MSHGFGTYRGDLDVEDAWSLLQKDPTAMLVDVRTRQEWESVGVPDLSVAGKCPLMIEWQIAPSMAHNVHFLDELAVHLEKRGLSKESLLLFLCRSGARSQAAAIAVTAAGYTAAFNLLAGFEGPPGPGGRRGTVEGWQARQLPWTFG